MSKSDFDYPIHYRDQPKAPEDYDKNAHGSQGGLENLPDQRYDAEDDFGDGAKGWTGDQSAFE